jgi:hypothetical protein
MKLNRKFINELGSRRMATVGNIISTLHLIETEGNVIQNLNENLTQLEEVFYTIDRLLENGLISLIDSNKRPVPDFNPSKFLENFKSGDPRAHRIHAMPKYLKKYWPMNLLVEPGFFQMIENGYKFKSELKEDKQFWLAIGVAVLSAFLTALFTEYLPRIF